MANGYKLSRVQGTAAPQPGQGARTLNSGTGTAKIGNDRNSVCPLFQSAQPEPGQGARTADGGAGGCASLAGRGTMEQK